MIKVIPYLVFFCNLFSVLSQSVSEIIYISKLDFFKWEI